jgi:hypothetical protein
LKPKSSRRGLRDLWHAFEKREPAACIRQQRVATLGVEMARLLNLSPWSGAAIRGSTFLSALLRAATVPASDRSRRTADTESWEAELRRWRWLRVCTDVLDGVQAGYDAGQPLSRRSERGPIESRILALSEDFERLASSRGGVLRALHALNSKNGHRHDPELVELLWSEAGQAVCHRALVRGATSHDRALGELEESLRLLDVGKPGPDHRVRRQPPPRRQEKVVVSPEPAAAPKKPARPREDNERREVMSRTTANEERSAEVSGHRDAGGAVSLTARVASAVSELEEIRAAANRGLEALASIAPAMEELSALVSRLQASLLPVQGGDGVSQAGQEPGAPWSIALRVEHPQGPLDVGEVADALDTLRDLRELHVQDQGSSWAVLRAQTSPDTDLTILQAKAAGVLTRRLGGPDDGVAVEVTLLQGE